MKTIIAALIIFAMFGCATQGINLEGTKIGPCYGQRMVSHDMMGCYYDVDKDEVPDIVLLYSWDGERLTLRAPVMISDFEAFVNGGE